MSGRKPYRAVTLTRGVRCGIRLSLFWLVRLPPPHVAPQPNLPYNRTRLIEPWNPRPTELDEGADLWTFLRH